jgi:diadenylate cyclase
MNVIRFITPLDIVDILIVSLVFYRAFLLIRQTRAAQLLKGLGLLIIVSFAAQSLKLGTMSWILTRFWTIGIIGIVVLFQPEIRRALSQLGQKRGWRLNLTHDDTLIDRLTKGVMSLSLNRLGAIIVIERENSLAHYIESGIRMGADLTPELLPTIFTPTTPLHDGAIIIREGRIVAARCILPLTDRPEIDLGTRHRSALGLSEQTDALIIIVSEETGKVSVAINGGMAKDLTIERLKEMLALYLPSPR